MQMSRFISKIASLAITALVLGGCSANAQTQHADDEPTTFVYRGLYTPSNTESVQRDMQTNHPDYDWGLWGHNLRKAISDNITESMYATVDGAKSNKQFCFSSTQLYKAVRNYIIDQFGYGTDSYSERISIMPMDNKIACTCAQCRTKGNTPGNATPAVTDFITRLAKEFPKHQFFTSAYHTTKAAPSVKLPSNVGMFISSISLPMRVDFTKDAGYNEFLEMIDAWKSKCEKIYIWDYERNYDDYLSPFPCLLAMQSRLQLYKQLGVSGVFINGSGDDYSAFDDVQTHTLALLLDNPDTDVHQAVAEYFSTHYPVTSDILTEYYWGLEMRANTTNHLLPLYGNMQEMCQSYLDATEFIKFRVQLDAMSKRASGDERKRLNHLLTSLAYTQLELYRCHLVPTDSEMQAEMREILKGHSEVKGMINRDESGHTIDDYLKQ